MHYTLPQNVIIPADRPYRLSADPSGRERHTRRDVSCTPIKWLYASSSRPTGLLVSVEVNGRVWELSVGVADAHVTDANGKSITVSADLSAQWKAAQSDLDKARSRAVYAATLRDMDHVESAWAAQRRGDITPAQRREMLEQREEEADSNVVPACELERRRAAKEEVEDNMVLVWDADDSVRDIEPCWDHPTLDRGVIVPSLSEPDHPRTVRLSPSGSPVSCTCTHGRFRRTGSAECRHMRIAVLMPVWRRAVCLLEDADYMGPEIAALWKKTLADVDGKVDHAIPGLHRLAEVMTSKPSPGSVAQ